MSDLPEINWKALLVSTAALLGAFLFESWLRSRRDATFLAAMDQYKAEAEATQRAILQEFGDTYAPPAAKPAKPDKPN